MQHTVLAQRLPLCSKRYCNLQGGRKRRNVLPPRMSTNLCLGFGGISRYVHMHLSNSLHVSRPYLESGGWMQKKIVQNYYNYKSKNSKIKWKWVLAVNRRVKYICTRQIHGTCQGHIWNLAAECKKHSSELIITNLKKYVKRKCIPNFYWQSAKLGNYFLNQIYQMSELYVFDWNVTVTCSLLGA